MRGQHHSDGGKARPWALLLDLVGGEPPPPPAPPARPVRRPGDSKINEK
jgi:hypothetical protein